MLIQPESIEDVTGQRGTGFEASGRDIGLHTSEVCGAGRAGSDSSVTPAVFMAVFCQNSTSVRRLLRQEQPARHGQGLFPAMRKCHRERSPTIRPIRDSRKQMEWKQARRNQSPYTGSAGPHLTP